MRAQPRVTDKDSFPLTIPSAAIPSRMRQIERREWWLWAFVVTVTLLLTGAVFSFAVPVLQATSDSAYWLHIQQSIRGLLALGVIFDVYSIYQRWEIRRVRRQL